MPRRSKRKAESSEVELQPPAKLVADEALPTTAYQMRSLTLDFFNKPAVDLAKALLGKILVRKLPDMNCTLRGRIVETEAYLPHDKGCCAYNGRRTPSNEAMFMAPGTAYVYMTYGMYFCFNISSQADGAAVLLRSLEPLEGLDAMQKHRHAKMKKAVKDLLKPKQLCNGPSKLCISFAITKELFNQKDLTAEGSLLAFEDDGVQVASSEIVECPRIGIGPRAGEWQKKPLRFYVKDSECVSVKHKGD